MVVIKGVGVGGVGRGLGAVLGYKTKKNDRITWHGGLWVYSEDGVELGLGWKDGLLLGSRGVGGSRTGYRPYFGRSAMRRVLRGLA